MGKRKIAFPGTNSNAADYDRNFLQRLLTSIESRRVAARVKKRAATAHAFLSLAHPAEFRPLREDEIPLVLLTHNDLKFLRSFLAHYRRLGVTRFICVDDLSTDGTREFLTAEPDVDIWTSQVRYREARRGRLWREALFALYGKNRWYLNVDSDEYLVYQDCFELGLPQLIRRLEQQGVYRLSAPMIDMYPPGPPSQYPFAGVDETMPWSVASCFDGNGYTLDITKRFLQLRGGPRQRKFGSDVDLIKYPLLYWDDKCGLGTTIHKPLPYYRNFFPISAALLHFKFFSDYKEKTTQAVEEKQHIGEAREYQKILQALAEDGDVNFVYDGMLQYSDPGDLVRQGFIQPVWADS